MKQVTSDASPRRRMFFETKEWLYGLLIFGVFLLAYFFPLGRFTIAGPFGEALYMLQDYAREHVLLCLVPAFFIAGAIANFLSQSAVIRYFGGQAKKWVSYSVASVSGTILAVCSCTVLPLFAGIYKRGAGIGPAIAFLYSGPAINILAVILTGRILGWQLGLARAIGAIVSAIVIGLVMAAIYRKEDVQRAKVAMPESSEDSSGRSLVQTLLYFTTLILILIFASWGSPSEATGFWSTVYSIKWPVTVTLLIVLAWIVRSWFDVDEHRSWGTQTWGFAKQILPLLFGGVLIAGFLMGRPESNAGLIPSEWIANVVGGNSLWANLLASIVGAFMYFATLTEVPILQGLIGSGMGQGPALALLLAGPSLSLPSILVIRSVLGNRKTAVYAMLVIAMATGSGMLFGSLIG